ncbi:MAG: TetR/AcrR family transcriptional regulator [Flavipsychrobacter sp.]
MRTRDIEKEELVKWNAIEMVVKEGLDNFSMNKLAKACGVSVATLYIYYKDKDDLITKIGVEEAAKVSAMMLKGLDTEGPFAEGLKQQWVNRINIVKNYPQLVVFFDQLRASSYQEKVFSTFDEALKGKLGRLMSNAIERGEIAQMPIEVYWSIAFAPLYNLLRFDQYGRSLAGKPFKMNEEVLWQTYDLALKALRI